MNVQGAVVDLDGTVYRGDEPIPGAVAAIETLRERGIGILFVTNNPTRSRAQYVDRLAEFGIDAAESEVLSAGTVTAEYLADRHATDDVFLVGSSGLRVQLQDHGIDPVSEPEAADVLITSHTYDFDYEALTEGLWALDSAEHFYGTDPDLVYPGGDGRRYPGSGAITRSVAAVAQREPDLVLGKPSGVMVELATAALHCQPSECLVVGDGLDTDVAFGARAGMYTALVLSGRTSRTEAETASPTPDFVVDSLADVPGLLD
ncbi:HAD-IIA family hydrolase [Halorarius litoreus]|uniref:HAD-IIA family hydrolase n=1 Tax=Halorarius litoreus TaxID=2962676 RepID=UPI0020CBD631|nr:HAD-IIA family hydrolase [Halorarius litoreus]